MQTKSCFNTNDCMLFNQTHLFGGDPLIFPAHVAYMASTYKYAEILTTEIGLLLTTFKCIFQGNMNFEKFTDKEKTNLEILEILF